MMHTARQIIGAIRMEPLLFPLLIAAPFVAAAVCVIIPN